MKLMAVCPCGPLVRVGRVRKVGGTIVSVFFFFLLCLQREERGQATPTSAPGDKDSHLMTPERPWCRQECSEGIIGVVLKLLVLLLHSWENPRLIGNEIHLSASQTHERVAKLGQTSGLSCSAFHSRTRQSASAAGWAGRHVPCGHLGILPTAQGSATEEAQSWHTHSKVGPHTLCFPCVWSLSPGV